MKGKFTNRIFQRFLNKPESGEGSNLFEFLDGKDIVIGKLFKYGLSKNALKIYLILQNPNYTEVFIDYSILQKETKLYFGFFNKINFNYKYIPGLFNENETQKLLYESINFIHEKKILHNDIKPTNIMCTSKNIILIDFEFAVLNLLLPLSESIIYYTHPKVLANEKVVWQNIDYWAGVCSIYEIYNDKVLFDYGKGFSMETELKKTNKYIVEIKKFY